MCVEVGKSEADERSRADRGTVAGTCSAVAQFLHASSPPLCSTGALQWWSWWCLEKKRREKDTGKKNGAKVGVAKEKELGGICATPSAGVVSHLVIHSLLLLTRPSAFALQIFKVVVLHLCLICNLQGFIEHTAQIANVAYLLNVHWTKRNEVEVGQQCTDLAGHGAEARG
jgi:hypothetical protein